MTDLNFDFIADFTIGELIDGIDTLTADLTFGTAGPETQGQIDALHAEYVRRTATVSTAL